MSWFQRSPQRPTLIWALALVLSSALFPSPAQAEWWWPPSWFAQSSNWGPPSGNYTGAAQRGGSCPKVEAPLTALAPFYQAADGSQFVLGATASDRPILWFYLPYAIGDQATTRSQPSTNNLPSKPVAELRLETQDPQTQEVSQRIVTTLPAANPGVIGVPLPATESPLLVGKTYHWLLVVRCDPNDASTNQFTELSLHRVQPATAPLPGSSPSLHQALDFYIQNGLWAETMSLCDRVHSAADDPVLLAKWSQTIQSVPFDGIDAARVVMACRLGKQKVLQE